MTHIQGMPAAKKQITMTILTSVTSQHTYGCEALLDSSMPAVDLQNVVVQYHISLWDEQTNHTCVVA